MDTASLWTLLGCILGASGQLRPYGTHRAHQCFRGVGVPRLELAACQPDERIVLTDAFMGVSADYEGCSFHRTDCVQPLPPDADARLSSECMGQSQCSVTVGVAWMSKCHAYSTYSHALYQCIPKEDILDICQKGMASRWRVGFLASPAYPAQYPAPMACECNVSTANGQRLLLSFSDVVLPWSPSCATDVLEVWDQSTQTPRCGRLPRGHNITSQSHKLRLSFRTRQPQILAQSTRFLLTVEALGGMDITCHETRSTGHITTVQPEETTEPPTTRAEVDEGTASFSGFFLTNGFRTPDQEVSHTYFDYTDATEEPQTSPNNEMSALAAIIVGIVLLSALLIGAAFAAIWLKKRRHKEEISAVRDDHKFPRLQQHRATEAPPPPLPPPLLAPPPVARVTQSPESCHSAPKERKSRIDFNRSSSASELDRKSAKGHSRSKHEGRSKRSKSRGKTVHYK